MGAPEECARWRPNCQRLRKWRHQLHVRVSRSQVREALPARTIGARAAAAFQKCARTRHLDCINLVPSMVMIFMGCATTPVNMFHVQFCSSGPNVDPCGATPFRSAILIFLSSSVADYVGWPFRGKSRDPARRLH
jgi:hypothetical protein